MAQKDRLKEVFNWVAIYPLNNLAGTGCICVKGEQHKNIQWIGVHKKNYTIPRIVTYPLEGVMHPSNNKIIVKYCHHIWCMWHPT